MHAYIHTYNVMLMYMCADILYALLTIYPLCTYGDTYVAANTKSIY